MATITNSVVVESVPHGGYKRNRYRYTIDNGEVHERRGWIPTATDDATDMAMRGALLLNELTAAEIEQLLGGGE